VSAGTGGWAQDGANPIIAHRVSRTPRNCGQATAVAATLSEISREQLWQKLGDGDELVLVDALSPMSYAHSHLPGAINLPPDRVDEFARKRIPDPDMEIVVYCASADCDSSIAVANRLIALGYRRVRHYVEGKRDWAEAGLPLETQRDRTRGHS
jgi:rhodanese-related sulfurtransferase